VFEAQEETRRGTIHKNQRSMYNMLNKQTIEVLQQVNKMTNSVILKFPETVAVSEAQDMMIMFNVEELDGDSFEDIGLKNSLGEFLNLVKLFGDERVVEVNNGVINIAEADTSSVFITDNIQLMNAEDVKADHFTKTEEVPTVAEFTLTTQDIKKIKSSSGVFKDLTEVIFSSEDDGVFISLGATNRFNAKSNKFSIKKSTEIKKHFEIKIPVDNFKMLPEADYTMFVKYNSNRDAYRIFLISDSLESFKILMTVKT